MKFYFLKYSNKPSYLFIKGVKIYYILKKLISVLITNLIPLNVASNVIRK